MGPERGGQTPAGGSNGLAEVRTLYEESVDCGSPEGCWELALLKESGKGTAVDQEGADGLIRRAAEKGFGPACTGWDWRKPGPAMEKQPLPGTRKGPLPTIPRPASRPVCAGKGGRLRKGSGKSPGTAGQSTEGGLDEAREPLEQVDLVLGDRFQGESRYGEALACYEEAAEGENAEAMLKAAAAGKPGSWKNGTIMERP